MSATARTRAERPNTTRSEAAVGFGGALTLLDPRGPYLVPALSLIACRMVMASQVAFLSEDAFITLRYAWNWVHGAGPVYNAGEHVMGFTSAPWMAWLALGLKLGQDPSAWARFSLLAADLVTLLAFTSLLQRHASRASAWCFALFFAFWPYYSGLAATGLETGVLVMGIALTAWLVDRRASAAGVALGMLALLRPEGVIAALVIALWASWRNRAIAAAILVAGAIVLGAYYGSPIPQSVVAKQVVYGTPGPLHAKQWWDWAFPFPLSNQLSETSEGSNFFLLAVLVTPAALAGAHALWGRKRTLLTAAALAACAIWLANIVAGTSYFFWYFAVPLTAWILLASVGMPLIVRGRWIYAGLLLAVLGHWTFEGNLYRGRAATEGQSFGGVAQAISERAKPGQSIFLEPIGTIGYACTNLRILDEVGLVSPVVSRRRAKGEGWYADILDTQKPTWLVVRAGFLRNGNAFVGTSAPFRNEAERARMRTDYQLVTQMSETSSDQTLEILYRLAP